MASGERERWDAVVIGSGLGGLTAAAYLCAAGRRTLVLEAHYVAGGNSQVFRRQNGGRSYEFDVGIHYIGECGRDGLITSALHGVGLAERVVFRPLDPDGYSTLIFPDFTFRVPVGWDRYRQRLLDTFPEEAEALGKVVDLLRQVGEESWRLQRGEFEMQDAATEAPRFLEWGLRPITDLFEAHRLSPQASAVLVGEQGTYAVRPSRTPVVIQAAITNHFLRGAYYPEGGGQVIAAMSDIGRSNIEFVRQYLYDEGLQSEVEDVGGHWARRLRYYPSTGKVLVKHLPMREAAKIGDQEENFRSKLQAERVAGDVELF